MKLKDLKAFAELNITEMSIIQGGLIAAKKSSKEKDVDSGSGDSYSGDNKS